MAVLSNYFLDWKYEKNLVKELDETDADSGDFRFEFVTLKRCFASYRKANEKLTSTWKLIFLSK